MAYNIKDGDGWASQTTWVIDPVNGNDANTGVDDVHALKTWAELRRRMIDVGGHTTDGTTITIKSSLSETLILDWGAPGINIHIEGTTSVVRSGSLTAAPTNRNPASNQANVITDSAVSSWSSDVAFTAEHILTMTSGNASGRYAYVVKDLGSHQARVSTFTWVDDLIEVFPSSGDTYQILSVPFVPNYVIAPPSGFFYFKFLQLGDVNSTQYIIAPAPATTGCQFTYCFVGWIYTSQTTIYFINSCALNPISLFTGTVEIWAGCIGDTSGSPNVGEIETAGELYLDLGALFQGVEPNAINCGYIRCVDGMIFDSTSNGVSVGTGGVLRITKISGSGNAGYGVSIANSGTVFANLATCYVTGTSGNVNLAGTLQTWSALQSAGYSKSSTSFASIGPV